MRHKNPIVLMALLTLSLLLAACGEAATSTANPVANNITTAASTVAPTTSVPATTAIAATTAAPATTAAATTAAPVTTAPATTAAAGKGANVSKATPDMIVKKLYTDLKSGDLKKGDTALITANLRNSLMKSKKEKGLAGLDTIVGLSNGQTIDSFEVGKATITGNSATVTATLKLGDGNTLTNQLTLSRNEIKTKQGAAETIWQVDQIKAGS